MNRKTLIQLLRSGVFRRRPLNGSLYDGEPAVNFNADEPGLFFGDDQGGIFKVGPTAVGNEAPNSGLFSTGNCPGEQWLDTTNPNSPNLKVYDGQSWRGTLALSNTLWVDLNGDDDNDGYTPQTAKRTIKAALEIAQEGTQIRVAAGNYVEDNPLVFPFPEVSIVGADLRDTSITLLNDDDLFQVLSGCYVQNFAFYGSVTKTPNPLNPLELIQSKGIMSFRTGGSGIITKSPYVQNCTNFVNNSIGLNVDGSKADGLRSMVLDSFTQFNPDGLGVKVFNRGYCQVVSMFTVCTDKSILAESGGLVSVTNSNSDFGNYAMYADGVGPNEQSGQIASGPNAVSVNNSVFKLVAMGTEQPPYVGQVVTFGQLYYNVSKFVVTNPGGGYIPGAPPSIVVSVGTGPNAVAAQGVPIINSSGQITEVEVISNGQNYTQNDVITVQVVGGGGGGGAIVQAVKNPVYYTLSQVLEPFTGPGGTVTISIAENLPYTPAANDVVNFYRVSRIIASSHCMEYVGSGTNIVTALPFNGGTAIQENEVVQVNGGRVAITSTDQLGDFRVGEQLVINQNTGTIEGEAFRKSILSTVIPYILSLS